MPIIIDVESRWRDIVASPPNIDLVVAILLGSLSFVEALERTVMPFIKPPMLMVFNPVQVKLISDIVPSLDGSLENRCVAHVKLI